MSFQTRIHKKLAALSLVLIVPLLSASQDRVKASRVVGITVSLPWLNSYRFFNYDLDKAMNKSGFVGLGGSIFYIYGKSKYSLNYGFTGDLPAPIGAIDYGKEGTRSNIGGRFWEGLYHKSVLEKVNLVGGWNYLTYRYSLTSYIDSIPSFTKYDHTTGLTVGVEYLFGRNSSVVLFYRPTVVGFGQGCYRQLMSLDARFDIKIWKKE